MWMQTNAGAGDAPEGRDPRERRRGLRAFLVVSLVACVLLLGLGGVIAGAGLGGLALGASGTGQRPTQSRTTPPDTSKITTNQPQDPDIVPSCDCQTSQTTANINLELSGVGKEILVDINKQQLFAYLDGQLQFTY